MSSPGQREQVQAVLNGITERLEALPAPVRRKVAPILAQAQAEVERDLARWLADQDNEDRFTTQRMRAVLLNIRQGIDTLSRVEPELAESMTANSVRVGLLSTRNVEEEFLRFNHIFTGELRPVGIEAATVIARGDRLVLQRYESSSKRYHGWIRKRLVQEFGVSRVRGESIHEMARRLERSLPHMFGQFDHAADRLARTETMNAYNVYHQEAIVELAKDEPGTQMRWDASWDRRRCPQCAALDGSTVEVTGEFEAEWKTRPAGRKHNSTHEHPPAHPNCRCLLVAWHVDWSLPGQNDNFDSKWRAAGAAG